MLTVGHVNPFSGGQEITSIQSQQLLTMNNPSVKSTFSF